MKKADLIKILIKANFTPMSKIDKIRQKGKDEIEVLPKPEEEAEEDEGEEEEADKPPLPAKEYDYLLTMPLWSLTYEKVNELLKQKDDKTKEFELLSSTTTKDMWFHDMEEFLRVLDETEALEEEERQIADKTRKKGGAGVKGGKRKPRQKNDEEAKPKPKKGGEEGNGGNGKKKKEKVVDDLKEFHKKSEIQGLTKRTLPFLSLTRSIRKSPHTTLHLPRKRVRPIIQ